MTIRPLISALALTAVVSSAALARPASAAVPGQDQVRGTITAFDGKYDAHVRTRAGEIDDVALHPGTIINPTGLTLRAGMRVTILGNRAGATFDANEIDTPYHVDYVPVAEPAFGYGYGYGFGPSYGGFDYRGSPMYGRGFYGAPFVPVYEPRREERPNGPRHGEK